MNFIYSVIAILFAISIHESAHAWMADRLGDPTGKMKGRISLNPMKHLDLFGTLALVFFHIGWGKPVPYNPMNLGHPRRDGALIALAGPLSNLLCAIIVALPLKYLVNTGVGSTAIVEILSSFFWFSILLFSLNVLPFPPLDGSKIIGFFVPHKWQGYYNRFLYDGVKYSILFILFDVIFLRNVYSFSVLGYLIGRISETIIAAISLGT